MESIQKTITRHHKERKDILFYINDRRSMMIIGAFLIIFGLEVYYQNQLDRQDHTIYLCGLWTCVYGIIFFLNYLIARQARKRFDVVFRNTDGLITESVQFSDESFFAEIKDYFSLKYEWNFLTGFNETKKYLRFTLAGAEFLVAKKHFSNDELVEINRLLQTKLNLANKLSSN